MRCFRSKTLSVLNSFFFVRIVHFQCDEFAGTRCQEPPTTHYASADDIVIRRSQSVHIRCCRKSAVRGLNCFLFVCSFVRCTEAEAVGNPEMLPQLMATSNVGDTAAERLVGVSKEHMVGKVGTRLHKTSERENLIFTDRKDTRYKG